jgi:hypothetical protein
MGYYKLTSEGPEFFFDEEDYKTLGVMEMNEMMKALELLMLKAWGNWQWRLWGARIRKITSSAEW